MKKVLFLVGTYLNKPSANGICCEKIAKKFVDDGYEVHFVCYGNPNGNNMDIIKDKIVIHPVNMTFKYSLIEKYNSTKKKRYHHFSRFLTFINYFRYPFLDKKLLHNYEKKVRELNDLIKFDIAISIYHPIEALYCGNFLKNENNSLTWIIYSLDTLTNFGTNNNIINKYLYTKNRKYEMIFFNNADLIVNMISHQEHYKQKEYNKYSHKMVFSDIPMLEFNQKKEAISKPSPNNKVKNIVYGGSLNYQMRNPTYICKFFMKVLEEDERIKVSFYSKGNCINIIKKYEKESKGHIELKDFVNHDEMLRIISKSDIVISMENKNSVMIPSKIFEYISYNKKIIHFSSSNNDILLNYFSKYPNVLIVNTNDEIINNIVKFKKFIKEKNIIVDDILKLYEKNTIEYTYKLINKSLKKEEN